MITMTVDQYKASFFDREKVTRAVDRGRRQALARSGGLIRTTARRSMRRRRGRSRPGQPPHAHAGQLRDLLFFAYDDRTRSVIVGPAAFPRRTGVPGLLEFGGRTRAPAWWMGSQTHLTIQARPYMRPALEVARTHLAGHWRGVVRNAA
jgi:hypothetical protein